MDTEVKLFNSSTERERYENLADLYAIIVSLENLERSFIRDSVTQSEYTTECSKLLSQYKTVSQIVNKPDLKEFAHTYKLSCAAALHRLDVGVPSTIEHETVDVSGNNVKHVAKIVQDFITVLDALNLNMLAVDKLHPLLTDLVKDLNSASFLPADYKWRSTLKDWLITLNKMKASDELDADQSRQLIFDLEKAYADFHKALDSKE
ncbi:putative vacuolar protein sorting-associated protein VPS28 [Linderina pennispora]|uniref:Vacuolar protein sorting-associated protein 28 n=1 Tax=Linderina pennispora TaxID=61395 RepID=A0A1Y1VYU7_9FUNG|nr:putative vacuolar protein sorting-associated protein VPS28 [Linderina pennispora]ORX66422.1 putative vacuolar protein sorting-associated protein VPS28 [Linderina pennispora]